MKKIAYLIAMILLVSKSMLFAQDVNMNPDGTSKVLCKKWKLDYMITEGKQIQPIPGSGFNFEFKKNNIFIMTYKNTDINGTWTFDPGKKLIRLTMNKSSRMTIVSLKDDELIMLTDMSSVTPNDPTDKMVYVPLN